MSHKCKCGLDFSKISWTYKSTGIDLIDDVDMGMTWNYCPNCGKKIKRDI